MVWNYRWRILELIIKAWVFLPLPAQHTWHIKSVTNDITRAQGDRGLGSSDIWRSIGKMAFSSGKFRGERERWILVTSRLTGGPNKLHFLKIQFAAHPPNLHPPPPTLHISTLLLFSPPSSPHQPQRCLICIFGAIVLCFVKHQRQAGRSYSVPQWCHAGHSGSPLQCETTQDGHQEILIHIIGVRHWDDNLFSLCCWRPKVEYSTFFSHVHPLTGNVRNTNVSIKIFIVWFSMFVPQKVLGKEKRKMWEKDDRLLLLDALWRGRECW